MPKVVISPKKGLVQSSGKGLDVEGDTAKYGFHVLSEDIDLALGNALVAGRLSRYIPAGAVITRVSAVVSKLGGTASSIFNVCVSTTELAVGAAAAGTEYLGASAGATTLPNGADINAGSNGVLGETQLNNTAVDQTTNAAYVVVNNAGNLSAHEGDPRVTVTVEWFGLASVAI